MVVSGLPVRSKDHPASIANMAIEIMAKGGSMLGGKLQMRIGIHTGPCAAGK